MYAQHARDGITPSHVRRSKSTRYELSRTSKTSIPARKLSAKCFASELPSRRKGLRETKAFRRAAPWAGPRRFRPQRQRAKHPITSNTLQENASLASDER